MQLKNGFLKKAEGLEMSCSDLHKDIAHLVAYLNRHNITEVRQPYDASKEESYVLCIVVLNVGPYPSDRQINSITQYSHGLVTAMFEARFPFHNF